MTKHRQQSTRVKAEGTDLIWSQIWVCFSCSMQSLHSQRPTYISQLSLSSLSAVLHSEIQPGIDCVSQFSSVTQSCPTLCDPMNCSTPGLPVHHQLLEFTQTHVHRVSDAIQPSHPLSSPSPAPNPSQHQSFPMSQLFA